MADKPEPKLRLLIPAYFYPNGPSRKEWDRLAAAADKVPIIAIVNPASGPGKAADDNYVAVVKQMRKAGVRLVGYVSTSYAKRPLAEVKADIERWPKFYPEVQGYFFDEQASGPEAVEHYAALALHARKSIKDATVIANPGTLCSSQFLAAKTADTFCLFENEMGYDGFRLPAWADRYAPWSFAALAHTVPTADRMRRYVEQTAQKKIGYFFVTDATGVNPWSRLPMYWDEEVAAVRAANGS